VKSLIITSQKGGVGKTTVAVNLAYAMARRGWVTLLVDADPQGGVGYSISRKARGCAGFYDSILAGREVGGLILATRLPELSILPSGRLETFFAHPMGGGGQREELAVMMEAFAARGFELVIFDTPAGLGDPVRSLLRVGSHALVPQQAEPLAARSLPQLVSLLGGMREEGEAAELAGVLLTMVQSGSGESLRVVKELHELLPAGVLLRASIPRSALFLRASEEGVPLGLLQRSPSPESLAFDQVAAILERRMGMGREEDESRDGIARLMD